jgi:hypothetical protein
VAVVAAVAEPAEAEATVEAAAMEAVAGVVAVAVEAVAGVVAVAGAATALEWWGGVPAVDAAASSHGNVSDSADPAADAASAS